MTRLAGIRASTVSSDSDFLLGRAPLMTTLPTAPAKPRTSALPRSRLKPGTCRAISNAVRGAKGAKNDASYWSVRLFAGVNVAVAAPGGACAGGGWSIGAVCARADAGSTKANAAVEYKKDRLRIHCPCFKRLI